MKEHQTSIIMHDGADFHFAHTTSTNLAPNDYYRHSHTRYELYVFFGGSGDFCIEDRVFKMSPGTILLIPPHTYHYIALENSDSAYDRLVINFERTFVFPELHSFIDSGVNPFTWSAEKHNPQLADLEQSLSNYQHRDKSLIVQLFLNRMLIDMKYMHKSLLASHMVNPTVTLILNSINDHINEPLSLKTLSGYTFLNQSYISQVFNAYMKIGVMDYVKQKKIYLAEAMIKNDGISPTEASRRMGFSDYSTFYRLYKKFMKQSPSETEKN